MNEILSFLRPSAMAFVAMRVYGGEVDGRSSRNRSAASLRVLCGYGLILGLPVIGCGPRTEGPSPTQTWDEMPRRGTSSPPLTSPPLPPPQASPRSAPSPWRCAEERRRAAKPTPPRGECPDAVAPLDHARGRVSFDNGASVQTEIARSIAERERGLSRRTALGDDHGMLFVFEHAAVQVFWMQDTCIPLDMIFIDDEGSVVGILEDVPPLNDVSRAVTCPSRYTLEVNAGWSRARGIEPGMKVTIEKELQ